MGFCSSSGRLGSRVEGLEPCSGARVSTYLRLPELGSTFWALEFEIVGPASRLLVPSMLLLLQACLGLEAHHVAQACLQPGYEPHRGLCCVTQSCLKPSAFRGRTLNCYC